MKDVWKWIAITTVAFLLGGGLSTLFGQMSVSKLEEDLKLVHNIMAQEVTANKDELHAIEVELAKINTKLDFIINGE